MEACVLPISYEYSKYLYYSSFLIGVSSVISFYFKDYTTVLFLFLLFLTSIHYWYKPDYGIMRNLDMSLCKIINLYFYTKTVLFYDEFCREVYVNASYSVLFFYITEHLLCYYRSKKWIVFHMAIHFYVAIFTPFVLYLL